MQYVLHFPKGEKYVSIVKTAEEPAGAAALDRERSRLRALLARQLAEVAMVTEADEGATLQVAASMAAAAAVCTFLQLPRTFCCSLHACPPFQEGSHMWLSVCHIPPGS